MGSPKAAPPTSASEGSARFARDLTTALGRTPAPGEPLALAVSGGPDSMAMLALAHAAFPGQLIAATLDHGLRADAGAEAAMVAQACARLSVPHATLSPETPIAGASLQARARDTRYALLADWAQREGAAALLTAHHADDQAETLLMRAARGSGLSGLAAIREHRGEGAIPLVRPLLGWRRAELRAAVEAAGLPFIDDPSNADPRFDRTRFRALLEANAWLDADRLARTAANLADAEAALSMWVDQLAADRLAADGESVTLDPSDLPREVLRRLTIRAITSVRAIAGLDPAFREEGAAALVDSLGQGKSATIGEVQARPKRGVWRFSPAPPRRSH